MIPVATYAQAQLVSNSSSTGSTSTETPILSLAERRVLPLFGELRKSSDQIQEEIRFLSDCDQNFADRKEASQFFAARGWEYLQEGRLDTATYRFNLAYLLNDKNIDSFWGLGVICFQRNDLGNAVRMLSKGVDLEPTNVALAVDLSSVSIKQYEETADSAKLEEVHRLLEHVARLDTTYAQTFFNLAVTEYYKEEYEKAWENLHKGRVLNFSMINLPFVEQLAAKHPDPQGFFK